VFPVVDGIPVMHLEPVAVSAREHVEAGRPREAFLALFSLNSPEIARHFEAAVDAPDATYQSAVEALGPDFEGGYFLYRFSDRTYVVADAVVRAVGRAVLRANDRAIDVCGGSGHLTRTLLHLSSSPPFLADLYYAKLWLARRFTAPGCVPVCCDGNAPLPFARGAFRYAMCSDAFQYIWTKRQLIGEMTRLVDADDERTAVLINHAPNQLAWSPSHGQPLSPAGYRDLFEQMPVRLFAESRLRTGIVRDDVLDLSQEDSAAVLDDEQALTMVATAD